MPFRIFLILNLFLVITACHSPSTQSTIRVASAANTQYVLEELIRVFEQTETIKVDQLISSSGKLTAQIENGAPIDIFISADMKYPKYLAKQQLIIEPPIVYAKGQLILWSMQPNIDLASIAQSSPNKIAVADPTTAHYGELAIEFLKSAKLYEQIKPNLVYGESIAQVNQYVMTGSVDVGLTAYSVVKAPQLQKKGYHYLIPNVTIDQGMVLIQDNAQSRAFYEFLQSKQAKSIFEQYGYDAL